MPREYTIQSSGLLLPGACPARTIALVNGQPEVPCATPGCPGTCKAGAATCYACSVPAAPAEPTTLTLTQEQLQSIVSNAVAAVVAQYTAAPTLAPLTLDTAAPTICDECTARMEPCSVHGGVTAAPPVCNDCTARMEPCSVHGGTTSARPAAPTMRPAAQPDNGPVLNLKALLPFNWADPSTAKRGEGPDTRLVKSEVETATRAYAHRALNGGDGLRTLGWTYQTGPKGARRTHRNTVVAASIGAKLAAGRSFYYNGAPKDTCLSLDETRRLLWLAHLEAHAPRAIAAETSKSTDSARQPAQYPQNAQYHTRGESLAAQHTASPYMPAAASQALLDAGWTRLTAHVWRMPNGQEWRENGMRQGALSDIKAAIGA